jgi:hypothetical protein
MLVRIRSCRIITGGLASALSISKGALVWLQSWSGPPNSAFWAYACI